MQECYYRTFITLVSCQTIHVHVDGFLSVIGKKEAMELLSPVYDFVSCLR